MNWIFEVYGDTYNSILLQNKAESALHKKHSENSPEPPLKGLLGFLGRNRTANAG